MGIMVRPSTQQTVDRIVGAATILGLSIAIARWISLQVPYSSPDNDNYPSPKNKENPTKCDSKYDASFAKRWIMPWWWPVIAMRRWNSSKNKHNRQQNGTDDGDDYFKSQSSHEGEEGAKGGEDDELQCDHRGSCHCGSINFVLRGPQHLKAVDFPGKIRYPHVPTTADRFQLLRGADYMKVYFVEDNSDNNDDADDSAALSSEHHQRQKQTLHQSQHQQQQSGAHAFCANCGVHILRAPDQSSELLEVNANCIEDGGTQRKIKLVFRNDSSFASSTSSVTNDNLEQDREGPTLRSSASTVAHNIETVAENEPLCLGSNNYHCSSSSEFHHAFWESLDDERRNINNANNIPRKESISSSTSHTHPESYTATNDYDSEQDMTTPCVYTQSIAESDDYSMGSSSITASLGGGARSTSGLSHYSNTNINHRAGMLPPLSSRMQTSLSSDRSVKTLPPRWSGENCSEVIQQQRTNSIGHSGEYATTRHGGIMSGANSVGAGFNMDWSVASMESNDLDLAGGGGDMGRNKMTVSPRMRDQMKRYMSRHMGGEQK